MPTTFYLTTYALTKGVIQADNCELTSSGKYVTRGAASGVWSDTYVFAKLGLDAFHTEGAASTRVAKIAEARIRAINKKRARSTDPAQVQSLDEEHARILAILSKL